MDVGSMTVEIEKLILSAVEKQKHSDVSLSGEDESEPFATSDDHPIGSYSASASDQGADLGDGQNRFDILTKNGDNTNAED